jgi:ADP-ribosylglycohydrolase
MLGAIIGDTVGSIYEFNNSKSTKFELFSPNSSPTDDSVMSMAVAEWLLTDPEHTQEKLEESMLRWGKRYPHPLGGYGGAFCRWLFYPEYLGGRHPYNSWGNGSAMRCSACGWVAKTLKEAEELAQRSAEITHNHPEGIKGAQSVAASVWMARNNATKEEIREYITSRFCYNLTMTCDDIRQEYRFDASCQGTVPQAIVAFLDSSDFESAIRLAVSLGGDSDTLTCITGAIAEAFYKDIPVEIIEEMHNRIDEDWWVIIKKIQSGNKSSKVE